MHRMPVNLGLLLAGLTLTGCGPGPAEPPAFDRPNIILCLADDLGWGDVSYNGHPVIRTPNLDAMAANGLQFNRFYAGAPVCSPTRGSCLTGRHPFRYGVFSANVGHLRDEEVCLAEVLGAQGYVTGHFGKWHLGTLSPTFSGRGPRREPELNYMTPAMQGFDEWFSTEYAIATWDPYLPEHAHGGPFNARKLYWQNGEAITDGPEAGLVGCDSRIIMDHALPFIEQAVGNEQPFFTVIWFHAPHEPVIGGPTYRAMYEEQEENQQHYYAVVTALDEQMGRLRAALRELGVAENTMVWFASDNGPEGQRGPRGRSQGSAGPFRGRKRSLYEGGIRVPAILEWPAVIDEHRATDVPCVTSDYMPTVLEVLEMQMPAHPMDGASLLDVILRSAEMRPAPIAFEHKTQMALIDHQYKLVHNRGANRQSADTSTAQVAEWELYDLLVDPSETTNVAGEHPDITAAMKQTLLEWQASCTSSLEGADTGFSR